MKEEKLNKFRDQFKPVFSPNCLKTIEKIKKVLKPILLEKNLKI